MDVSEREAVIALFARVHMLAEICREKDKEERMSPEERRFARERAAKAAEVEE